MKKVAEAELIAGARRGEAAARGELYERYGALAYGICRRYVRDAATAEDLLHDGFVRLFAKIGDYRGEGSFEGWLRRIFVTTALGHLRRSKVVYVGDEAPFAALSAGEASALERLSVEELLECIARLPEGYRVVLNLHAVEGYPHGEVARMLGISENTSRSQFSRARVRLMEILKERGMQ